MAEIIIREIYKPFYREKLIYKKEDVFYGKEKTAADRYGGNR